MLPAYCEMPYYVLFHLLTGLYRQVQQFTLHKTVLTIPPKTHSQLYGVSTCCMFSGIPEMVDHVGHTEERQDKGTGPAVTLPDEVAAGVPGLAQPLLSNGSV